MPLEVNLTEFHTIKKNKILLLLLLLLLLYIITNIHNIFIVLYILISHL